MEAVRECCGGYRSGDAELYSPWDVQEFCSKAQAGEALCGESVWAGADGNRQINDLLNRADVPLLAGVTVPVEIDEMITCDGPDSRPTTERLLSALYADAYVTGAGRAPDGRLLVRFPNPAVRACIRKCVDRQQA